MALKLRKRRKFERGNSFIRSFEPGQSPVKVTQYEYNSTPIGFTGFERVEVGNSLIGECLGRYNGTFATFKCS